MSHTLMHWIPLIVIAIVIPVMGSIIFRRVMSHTSFRFDKLGKDINKVYMGLHERVSKIEMKKDK